MSTLYKLVNGFDSISGAAFGGGGGGGGGGRGDQSRRAAAVRSANAARAKAAAATAAANQRAQEDAQEKIRIQASIRSAEFASDVVIKGRFELAKDQREGRLAKIK